MLEDSGISNEQELNKKPKKLAAKNLINTMAIGLRFEKMVIFTIKVSIGWRCYLWTSLEAWSQGPPWPQCPPPFFFFSIVTFVLFYFIFIIILYI